MKTVAIICVVFFVGIVLASGYIDIQTEKQRVKLAEQKEKEKEDKLHRDWLKALHDANISLISKTIYGECRPDATVEEKQAVAWVILNRVDSELAYMPDLIQDVVTQEGQFIGYNASHPYENNWAIAEGVYIDWINGGENRTLPAEYLYFVGDGKYNYFSVELNSSDTISFKE